MNQIYESVIVELKIDNSEKNAFEVKNIDTSLEIGINYTFNVNNDEQSEAYKKYLPIEKGKNITIPLNVISNENKNLFNMAMEQQGADKETMAAVNMLLNSYKYRVFVSNDVVSNIKSAKLQGKGKSIDLVYYPAGNITVIEIPIYYYLDSKGDYNSIIITTK